LGDNANFLRSCIVVPRIRCTLLTKAVTGNVWSAGRAWRQPCCSTNQRAESPALLPATRRIALLCHFADFARTNGATNLASRYVRAVRSAEEKSSEEKISA